MKYWVKSIPPFVVDKSYLETTKELFKWLEDLIKKSKNDIEDYLKENPEDSIPLMLRKFIILAKVDITINPKAQEILLHGNK